MIPGDIKILVVDDMPTIRELVKGQLKTMGLKNVSEASDGEQALHLLIRHDSSETKIAMVIADWNMPKMTGLELLKRVRASAQWENLPFVLLTSEAQRDQVTEAVLSGVSSYIVKPFAGKSFEDKITAAWRKHHP